MAEHRPNILYIFTDQQYADAMSNVGNGDIDTPGLDSIASAGTRFDSAYCTFPLCTPSRASMFTGKMPSELGIEHNSVPLPEERREREMGWLFRDAGYETAYAGKWHLPGQHMEEGHGFDILCGMDDEMATRKGVEFLKADHERPFLLCVSLWQPHGCCPFHRFPDPRDCANLGLDHYGLSSEPPEDAPDFDWPDDAYEPSFLQRCPALPDNFAPTTPELDLITERRNRSRDIAPEDRPDFWQEPEEINAARNWPDEHFRYYRWAYYRLVEYLDAQIVRMLDALRESGQEDNTLVVFSSDHGDMLGAHRLLAKNCFYEEAIRVPLLMSFPGRIGPGQVLDGPLVSNGLDLLPTFCDYGGIDPPPDLEGRSLRPLAEGNVPSDWRRDLLLEVSPGMGNGRLLHTGRYKYAAYDSATPAEELYDLEEDPGELENVYDRAGYEPVLKDCRKRLERRRS
jgi:choline-sulfatase/glucosamine-6-phosphate deaminase